MKKNGPIIVAILMALTILALEISFSLDTHSIEPHTFDGTVRIYSDSCEDDNMMGESTVALDSVTSAGLYLSYELDRTFAYYYAGVEFINNELHPIDLSRYSHVDIQIDGGRSNTLRFFVLCDEKGFTKAEDSNSWRHLRKVIVTEPGLKTYSLTLSDFYTPQWWFETYKTSEPLLSKEPLKSVIAVKIESGEGEPTGIQEQIRIKRIRFYTPIPEAVRYIQIVLLILIVIILLFRFGIMKRVQLGKYKPIVLGNLFDEELDKITDYIGDHYQQTDLSLQMVSDACAMHQDKVTALIRQGYGQTFKQYLNRLRLTEAQRLLRSTDRQISEIAFAVGYNSVSHFNRVFKQQFSCTPREFRSE